MAKNQNLKNYIITFDDDSIPQTRVAELLGVSKSKVTDAVNAMEEAYDLDTIDNLHYEELGCACSKMTEEDAEKLRKQKGILEVVEDFEVRAIGDAPAVDTYTPNGTEEMEDMDADFSPMEEDLDWEDDLVAMDLEEMIAETDTEESVEKTVAEASEEGSLLLSEVNKQRAASREYVLWNITRTGAHRAWRRSLYGAGVRCAVLDTGVDRHRDLIVYGGASFVPGSRSYRDRNGHGTHCAGIIGARINRRGIVGMAPLCRIYAVKVLGDSGGGSFSWVLSGMAWALRNRMHVVSMSLGAARPPIQALTRMVRLLNRAGITVVAAAGNSGRSRNFPYVNTPANCPGVIAVGATDRRNIIAPFSSRGGNANQVTISAPGVGIVSTYPTNTYRSLSGTSMACPHVAGAVALIKRRYPAASPAWIRWRLMRSARDLGSPGNDRTYGAGLLAVDRAV